MSLCDVVDELLNDDSLADAGAAEESDLSTLHERGNQVDDLDAGLEDFRLRLEIGEVRRLAVNRPALDFRADLGSPLSTGSPSTLRMRPSAAAPTGTLIGAPVSIDFHSAHNAVGS